MTSETEYQRNLAQAEAQVQGLRWLGKLLDHDTDFPDNLERRIDERREIESENALSIEVERVVVIVLCTGGPHAEIRWHREGRATLVCYGWFGSDRYERGLTEYELDGVRTAYGDWEDLAEAYVRD